MISPVDSKRFIGPRGCFFTSKREQYNPLLKELPWLPIRERIQIKLYICVFKCLENTAPAYLSNLQYLLSLFLHSSLRTLRSALDITHLNVPITNKVLGRKSFSVAGPRSWNNLPCPIYKRSTNYVIVVTSR